MNHTPDIIQILTIYRITGISLLQHGIYNTLQKVIKLKSNNTCSVSHYRLCFCITESKNILYHFRFIFLEHALFMRGLLDPSEEQLIQTADGFAKDYRRLLDAASNVNERVMRSNDTVALTKKFRDFKRAGVEGIEGCEIKSIILPLLADHVLREANHYLRLLGA